MVFLVPLSENQYLANGMTSPIHFFLYKKLVPHPVTLHSPVRPPWVLNFLGVRVSGGGKVWPCLLYTSDAADELMRV